MRARAGAPPARQGVPRSPEGLWAGDALSAAAEMMIFMQLFLAVRKQSSCWMLISLGATKVWLLLKL